MTAQTPAPARGNAVAAVALGFGITTGAIALLLIALGWGLALAFPFGLTAFILGVIGLVLAIRRHRGLAPAVWGLVLSISPLWLAFLAQLLFNISAKR